MNKNKYIGLLPYLTVLTYVCSLVISITLIEIQSYQTYGLNNIINTLYLSVITLFITSISLTSLQMKHIKMAAIMNIKSSLIDYMYQQFDDIDLTVFNAEYFATEDEVLNFILKVIPNWFMSTDIESLYESINVGYLVKKNNSFAIVNKKNYQSLKVYYIKG